jgi:hypothetical protein
MSQRTIAIGDPQAPIEKFFEILERHRVLTSSGRIAPNAVLISIGDHFDWGPPETRAHSTRSGTEILRWLLSHDPAQAVIVFGNHDLARVGELAHFDQASYEIARSNADAIYSVDRQDKEAEQLARDFSCFEVEQRVLVEAALRDGRATLAHASARDRLYVHSAVTRDDLSAIGLSLTDMEDAFVVAASINAFVSKRVAAWTGGPLDLSPLHTYCAGGEEGRGILYQRPSHPDTSPHEMFAGPPRRRYDPRRLPLELTQIAGHIGDEKCRKLLGPWVTDGHPAKRGLLRSLWTDGHDVRYRAGIQENARLIFIDGTMYQAEVADYELYEG